MKCIIKHIISQIIWFLIIKTCWSSCKNNCLGGEVMPTSSNLNLWNSYCTFEFQFYFHSTNFSLLHFVYWNLESCIHKSIFPIFKLKNLKRSINGDHLRSYKLTCSKLSLNKCLSPELTSKFTRLQSVKLNHVCCYFISSFILVILRITHSLCYSLVLLKRRPKSWKKPKPHRTSKFSIRKQSPKEQIKHDQKPWRIYLHKILHEYF